MGKRLVLYMYKGILFEDKYWFATNISPSETGKVWIEFSQKKKKKRENVESTVLSLKRVGIPLWPILF